MYAAIPGLLAQGLSHFEIAAQFGVKPSSLKVLCSQRGISLRKHRLPGATQRKHRLPGTTQRKRRPPRMTALPLGDEVLRSLRVAARLLGRPLARLASDLLEKIASDSLYMAVLDEEPACDLPSTLASRRLRSISGKSRRSSQRVEVRHPVIAGDDRLTVDQERRRPDVSGSVDDTCEAVGPVMVIAGEAANAGAIPAHHQPVTIVFDFVNPERA
jgi:hypothetical protein